MLCSRAAKFMADYHLDRRIRGLGGNVSATPPTKTPASPSSTVYEAVVRWSTARATVWVRAIGRDIDTVIFKWLKSGAFARNAYRHQTVCSANGGLQAHTLQKICQEVEGCRRLRDCTTRTARTETPLEESSPSSTRWLQGPFRESARPITRASLASV